MYKLKFNEVAVKSLKKIPKEYQILILENIESLATNPSEKANVKRLVNYGIAYRLRVGNYRVLFDKNDRYKYIEIMDVLHRKDAYK